MDKVMQSDLVAVIEIEEVHYGELHEAEPYYSALQAMEYEAKVLEVLKGRAKDEIVFSASSTGYNVEMEDGTWRSAGSTAGFDSYGIEPGKRYIAYLIGQRGKYRITRNTNQCLEVISPDGTKVNDVGQVRDQVAFRPKRFMIKAYAFFGPLAMVLLNPLFILLVLVVIGSLAVVRQNRKKHKKAEAG